MTGVSEISVFDLCGALPRGTTVLEASAGTGKTHAIGALVARYVAEGVVTLDELLVVTFGRAASQELRERVRGHLVEAERALADPARLEPVVTRCIALLAAGPDGEVATRRERLRTALAGFDAATIVTTHQFCQYVLTGLGIAGDSDTDVRVGGELGRPGGRGGGRPLHQARSPESPLASPSSTGPPHSRWRAP